MSDIKYINKELFARLMRRGEMRKWNKKICIQCWQRHGRASNWNTMQEASWKKGDWNCPPKLFEDISFDNRGVGIVLEGPPSWCPYITEHEVSSEC